MPDPCDYRVEVQTGDTFGAGTNAKIMINIFGEMGSTGAWPQSAKGIPAIQHTQAMPHACCVV